MFNKAKFASDILSKNNAYLAIFCAEGPSPTCLFSSPSVPTAISGLDF